MALMRSPNYLQLDGALVTFALRVALAGAVLPVFHSFAAAPTASVFSMAGVFAGFGALLDGTGRLCGFWNSDRDACRKPAPFGFTRRRTGTLRGSSKFSHRDCAWQLPSRVWLPDRSFSLGGPQAVEQRASARVAADGKLSIARSGQSFAFAMPRLGCEVMPARGPARSGLAWYRLLAASVHPYS